MAMWQFTLDLIRADVARLGTIDAIRLNRQQLDLLKLNIAADQLPTLFDGLSALLPEKKPWSAGLRI